MTTKAGIIKHLINIKHERDELYLYAERAVSGKPRREWKKDLTRICKRIARRRKKKAKVQQVKSMHLCLKKRFPPPGQAQTVGLPEPGSF